MEETEISHFLHILVRMGEALQNSGAEVFRVEDTLNRIAIAYGAEDVNVFVITSSIVVTLTMPSLPPQTETRQEHLRHRLLFADEHRRYHLPQPERPDLYHRHQPER